MTTTVKPRRLPSQDRSKATVNQILLAAEALIARNGTGALKMREIAEQAEVPIGSLYMYFPNREAIIRTIVERYSTLIETDLSARVAQVKSTRELIALIGSIVNDYYKFLRSSPSLINLWTGSLYNKSLTELSIADSRRTAEILYHASKPFLTPRQRQRALPCFLVCVDTIGSIANLAVSLKPAEGDAVIEELQKMLVAHVTALFDKDMEVSAKKQAVPARRKSPDA
ncbi:TetR/AcrR family transcriptional regulator [Silvibacterium dinghuense]|uniref:TetR/AcrR family transcriptional regulator n=1 Tax=Silvibacterium dinghuense TaxID=1560006 RepID=A0A4Q1S8Q0_9BACT|nr:TetR/AcrR family transcriptional regulator [Silvibacterium dinghuense]RXS92990.1 TetR/AcrR family transcriptional regulator [Silvibacterium dinghuense]GGG90387.1 TetR family transcriptional regulator [Silvibacterium dinghuense]